MSNKEFALRTGKPEKTISHILNGKSAIMKDVADSFEIVTGIPSDYILRFQAKYEADVARLAKRNPLEQLWDDFGDLFPYSDLVKKGWIERYTEKEEKMRAILSFFGLTNEKAFREEYATQGVSFRKTGKVARTPYAVAAWIRQGQILASKMENTSQSTTKNLITSKIPLFKDALNCGDLLLLRSLCLEIGIKLVFVENLEKASISGAAYRFGGSSVVQLSGKGKTLDKLIYNFFHELGHIYHGHTGIQVDDVEDKTISEEETMADAFANKILYQDIKLFNHKPTISEVKTEATKMGVLPCVVLGHLTHIGRISYQDACTTYKSLQSPFEIDFESL